MKKNLFFLVSTVAFSMLMISCKKDKGEEDPDAKLPALTNVLGYWIGKYGAGGAEPAFDYAFLVNAEAGLENEGKIIVYENSADTTHADKAYGTWTFDPATKKFTTYYAYDQDRRYSTSGVLNHRSLIGTWGPVLTPTGGGTYKVRFKQ